MAYKDLNRSSRKSRPALKYVGLVLLFLATVAVVGYAAFFTH